MIFFFLYNSELENIPRHKLQFMRAYFLIGSRNSFNEAFQRLFTTSASLAKEVAEADSRISGGKNIDLFRTLFRIEISSDQNFFELVKIERALYLGSSIGSSQDLSCVQWG